MSSDFNAERFSVPAVESPLATLRAGHDLLRQLFAQYFEVDGVGGKRFLGSHVLLMLELHTAVEEGVLYPRVQEIDPALVEHCGHEHEQGRRIIEQLKPMDEGDPQAEALFRRLAEVVFTHIDDEEQRLFPRIEHAGLDLGAIAREMTALEAHLASTRSTPPAVRSLLQ